MAEVVKAGVFVMSGGSGRTMTDFVKHLRQGHAHAE